MALKVATYNVNGVNGRLPRLLEWLEETNHGVAILARGERPVEIRRGLPGDDLDRQARYLDAAVKGMVVASVYLPNGNPQPGPKFDYKLAWFARLNSHARDLLDAGKPAVLAGDLNVVPTRADIYNEWLWREDELAPSPAATGVDSAHRGREKPSDHAPVWVSLLR